MILERVTWNSIVKPTKPLFILTQVIRTPATISLHSISRQLLIDNAVLFCLIGKPWAAVVGQNDGAGTRGMGHDRQPSVQRTQIGK